MVEGDTVKTGEDFKKANAEKVFAEYVELLKKSLEQQNQAVEQLNRCTLCKKDPPGMYQVYVENIGLVMPCQNCIYKSIIFYAKKLFAVE